MQKLTYRSESDNVKTNSNNVYSVQTRYDDNVCLCVIDFEHTPPFTGSELYSTIDMRDLFCNLIKSSTIRSVILAFSLHEWSINRQAKNFQLFVNQFIEYVDTIYPNLTNIAALYPVQTTILPLKDSKYNIYQTTFDWWMARCCDDSEFGSGIDKNIVWSGGNNKAVAMFGDSANRIQKIGFVHYAAKKEKLELFDYSVNHRINYPWLSSLEYASSSYENVTTDHYYAFTDKLTKEESIRLYLQYEREFAQDTIFNSEQETPLFNKTSVMYPKEFQQASLNFVVETSLRMRYGEFTEKTWKPLHVGIPFVHMHPGDAVYKFLHANAFKTFLNYTDYPDIMPDYFISAPSAEKSVPYIEDMMETALVRVESFLSNIPKYKEQIAKDCIHNQKRLHDLQDIQYNKLLNHVPQLASINPVDVLRSLIM